MNCLFRENREKGALKKLYAAGDCLYNAKTPLTVTLSTPLPPAGHCRSQADRFPSSHRAAGRSPARPGLQVRSQLQVSMYASSPPAITIRVPIREWPSGAAPSWSSVACSPKLRSMNFNGRGEARTSPRASFYKTDDARSLLLVWNRVIRRQRVIDQPPSCTSTQALTR